MQMGEPPETLADPDADFDAGSAALDPIGDPARWRRVVLEYRPSFSPHPRMSFTWSRRGEWWMASSLWTWPPPLPDAVESTLMRPEDASRWKEALVRALRAGTWTLCAEDQTVERGEAHLVIEDVEESAARCVVWSEHEDASQLDAQVLGVMDYAPAQEEVDRWTHPFWLVEGSSVLRLELKGTAELWVDGTIYGRINGVVTLRLPVGKRVLTLRPLDDGDAQTIDVFLRKSETTIVRISMEDEAMTTVPSWSQPRR